MQSMDEIYQKYAQMVYRYLLLKTRSEDLAEELTQETFYQAIKSIDKFDGSCKLSTWLFGIAKNQLFNYMRKNPMMQDISEYAEELESDEKIEIDFLKKNRKHSKIVIGVAVLIVTVSVIVGLLVPEFTRHELSYDDAIKIFDTAHPYVGDHVKNGQTLSALDVFNQLGEYTLELQTSDEP